MADTTTINYDLQHAELVAKIVAEHTKADLITFKEIWAYLEGSEQQLLAVINNQIPPADLPGNIEFGPVLYLLNNDVLRKHPILEAALRKLGMPYSKITSGQWAGLVNTAEHGPGIVTGDGTLFSTMLYGQLDYHWALAVLSFVYFYYIAKKKAPFGTNPANVTADPSKESVTVAVFGDWGTGPWNDGTYQSPAMLVAKAINTITPKPDISIHLGDVYYSGSSDEELHNLLPAFPAGSLLDKQGNSFSFTMNSNHEMYDGAFGYFEKALSNSLFKIQNSTSYFVINFQDWVLVGLDSAYYDPSFFVMQGGIDAGQQAFIKGLNIPADKKVIVFTHHTAITTDGSAINNDKNKDGSFNPNNLFTEVVAAFNNRNPDFWYYGHTHNGIVYNDKSVTKNYKTAFGRHPEMRCMGHAAIPFGNGYDLHDAAGNPIAAVDYYAHTPLPDPNKQQGKRVLNGFALLTLSKGKLIETAFEVYPDGSIKQVWSKTSTF